MYFLPSFDTQPESFCLPFLVASPKLFAAIGSFFHNACANSFTSVTSHFSALGAKKNRVTGVMESSVVFLPNIAPLHSRKNKAVANRSSIFARAMPMQLRDPIPNGCAMRRCFSVGFSNRVSSNLVGRKRRLVIMIPVSRFRDLCCCYSLFWIREKTLVIGESIVLRKDISPLGDKVSLEVSTASGCRA